MATLAITGTITTAPTNESSIIAGGKTIILTLTGDTWVAAGATFDAQRQNIINGLNSAMSETNGWQNQVRANLAVTTVVRTSATVVTITLSAQAAYAITNYEEITVTAPATALVGAVALVGNRFVWVYDNAQIFYVRKTGSDSNSGATASAAWNTWTKAVGSNGAFSGATVYFGGGIYREAASFAMTNPTSQVTLYGDTKGIYTGDPGKVIITAYTVNDRTQGGGALIALNARPFIAFYNITVIGGNGTALNSTDATGFKLSGCEFIGGFNGGSTLVSITIPVDVVSNGYIENCIFDQTSGIAVSVNLVRPSAADIDVQFQIRSNRFVSCGSQVSGAISGANTFKAGGIRIFNNTAISNGTMLNLSSSANFSTTFPCLVYNNFCKIGNSSTILNANTAGQILEDYNVLMGSSPRANVTAGTHSVSDGSFAPLYYTGLEYRLLGIMRPYASPMPDSPLIGFGNNAAGPTTDIFGQARPNGTFFINDWAVATAGGAKTLTNSNKAWGVNQWAGYTIYIAGGTGSGQYKSITSNTTTVITVDGNWNTQPDNTSQYQIFFIPLCSTGTATAGSTTTLTDANAAWGTNQWQGYTLEVTAGTGSGQTATVTSNTGTVLTFAALGVGLNNTSVYRLYKGSGLGVIGAGLGAYEVFKPIAYPLKRGNRKALLNTFDNTQ